MFPRKFHICNAFGIPIYLDISTAILLFFFIGMTRSLMLDIASAILLLVSIVFHELGHSLTARAFGCRTRDITLMLIGGCASLERMPRKAWQELLTAAAGPAVSFLLGVVCYIGWLICPMPLPFTAAALGIASVVNFSLGAFNLLPGFPMDGGRILRSAARAFTTRSKATWIAMVVGRGCAVALVVAPLLYKLLGLMAGNSLFFAQIHAVLSPGYYDNVLVQHLMAMLFGGSFFMRLLIAWMIWNEGRREYQQTLVEESWASRWDFSARVSPPPYGGDEDDAEVRRGR